MNTLEMYYSIPVDKPISKKELGKLWGYSNERTVRDKIIELRKLYGGTDGHMIVSFSDRSGYFRTSNPKHIKHYKKEVYKRAFANLEPYIKQSKRLAQKRQLRINEV